MMTLDPSAPPTVHPSPTYRAGWIHFTNVAPILDSLTVPENVSVITGVPTQMNAALLSGAPPSILQRSLVAQHRQTIKVREWHFLEPEGHPLDENRHPLGPGNPSRGYVPDGIELHEYSDKLEVVRIGQRRPITYYSTAAAAKMGALGRVCDIFLTGEVPSVPADRACCSPS